MVRATRAFDFLNLVSLWRKVEGDDHIADSDCDNRSSALAVVFDFNHDLLLLSPRLARC